MVHHERVPDEIMTSLLLNPKAGADLSFVEGINVARRQRNWAQAERLCDAAQKLAFETPEHFSYLSGVVGLCRGTVYHAQGMFSRAIEQYNVALGNFSRVNDHGEGVALMALGFACADDVEYLAAAGHFQASYKVFSRSLNRHRYRQDQGPIRACERLVDRVKGLWDEMRRRQETRLQPQPVKRLIFVARSTAGPPLYSPDEDLATDEIELDGTVFGLVNPKTRRRRKLPLHQTDEYFETVVEGQSMIDAGIRHGDRLLVRAQPVVDPTDVAAVQVEDGYGTGILVKHVTIDPKGRTVLKSANPEVPDQVYADRWTRVTVLGKVIAILGRD